MKNQYGFLEDEKLDDNEIIMSTGAKLKAEDISRINSRKKKVENNDKVS